MTRSTPSRTSRTTRWSASKSSARALGDRARLGRRHLLCARAGRLGGGDLERSGRSRLRCSPCFPPRSTLRRQVARADPARRRARARPVPLEPLHRPAAVPRLPRGRLVVGSIDAPNRAAMLDPAAARDKVASLVEHARRAGRRRRRRRLCRRSLDGGQRPPRRARGCQPRRGRGNRPAPVPRAAQRRRSPRPTCRTTR